MSNDNRINNINPSYKIPDDISPELRLYLEDIERIIRQSSIGDSNILANLFIGGTLYVKNSVGELVAINAFDSSEDATEALATLADIADDEKITPVEKLTLLPIWNSIVTEATPTTGTIPIQATLFSVSDIDFDSAYTALNTYLTSTINVFNDMSATSDINRTTWDNAWTTYYNERTDLLNAIDTASKNLADSAASDATQALSDAATAITDAATAQGTADGKVTTFYSNSAPTAEGVGDLWIDTDDGNKLYRWSGSAWIEVQDDDIATAISNAATAQSTADGKIVSFYQDASPTADGVGDFWVDTNDNNKLYRWSGSAWVSVRDGTIATAQADATSALANAATAISDAATAQGTADGKVTTFYAASSPTAEGIGDLWLDSDDGNKLYRWSGSVWVEIQDDDIATAISNAATAQSTADGKIVSFYQDSEPTADGTGDLWVDTNDKNKLYRWSGSSWVTVRDTDIAQALSDALDASNAAAAAQTAADDAQSDATANIALLANIAADDEITPVEKYTIKPIWDNIIAEATLVTGTIPVQAAAYSVDDSAFDTAYANLYTYLITTLSDVFTPMTDTTSIVRATWDGFWKSYYDARTVVLNAITTAAADIAESSANTYTEGWADENADVTLENIASGISGQGDLATADSVLASQVVTADLAAISAVMGTLNSGTITSSTITGGTIRSAASGRRSEMNSSGIILHSGSPAAGRVGSVANGGDEDLVGSTANGGDQVLVGTGQLCRINNTNTGVPFEVVGLQASIADIGLFNRSSDPTTGKIGQLAVVNDVPRKCTAATPTWADL